MYVFYQYTILEYPKANVIPGIVAAIAHGQSAGHLPSGGANLNEHFRHKSMTTLIFYFVYGQHGSPESQTLNETTAKSREGESPRSGEGRQRGAG